MVGAHPDSDLLFIESDAVVPESVVTAVQGIPSIERAMMQRGISGTAAGGSRGTADLMRNTVERALGDRKRDVTVLAQTVFPWKMWLHNFDG